MLDSNLVEMYVAGRLTQEDLAIATDMSIMDVRQYLFVLGHKLTTTPSQVWSDEICILYCDTSVNELAKRYRADLLLINKMRYAYKERSSFPDRTKIKIAAATSGKTQAEIAKEYGVSQSTVSRHNPKRKAVKAYRKRITPKEWEDIRKYLADNGNNISDASRHFNVTRQSIYRKLNNDN